MVWIVGFLAGLGPIFFVVGTYSLSIYCKNLSIPFPTQDSLVKTVGGFWALGALIYSALLITPLLLQSVTPLFLKKLLESPFPEVDNKDVTFQAKALFVLINISIPIALYCLVYFQNNIEKWWPVVLPLTLLLTTLSSTYSYSFVSNIWHKDERNFEDFALLFFGCLLCSVMGFFLHYGFAFGFYALTLIVNETTSLNENAFNISLIILIIVVMIANSHILFESSSSKKSKKDKKRLSLANKRILESLKASAALVLLFVGFCFFQQGLSQNITKKALQHLGYGSIRFSYVIQADNIEKLPNPWYLYILEELEKRKESGIDPPKHLYLFLHIALQNDKVLYAWFQPETQNQELKESMKNWQVVDQALLKRVQSMPQQKPKMVETEN